MAKDKTLKFVVVTPERQIIEETAEAIVIPMHDGELGILPDRAPLMCELGIGQMRYQKAGRTSRLYIDGGFAQVLNNTVTVLTENALRAEDISDDTVAEAERQSRDQAAIKTAEVELRQRAQRRVSILRDLRGKA